jgi:hypothetical protein
LVVLAVGHALTWAGFDITKNIFDGLEAVAQVNNKHQGRRK